MEPKEENQTPTATEAFPTPETEAQPSTDEAPETRETAEMTKTPETGDEPAEPEFPGRGRRSRKARREREEAHSAKAEALSWVKTIVVALLLALFINKVLIVNATVPTGSMENTIMPDDRIVANRLSYVMGDPERGDIVVFRYPDDPTGKTLYVKRVIGLPGDTVSVFEGIVFINGVMLTEPYVKEEAYGDFGPYTVPEGCYFMMGDNRNNSLDSRYWQNTFVEQDDLLGKVVFRYYPHPGLIRSTNDNS